ncbi:MAG: hypothetical protein ABL860_03990 [Candidatus Nitrotoga sp.]
MSALPITLIISFTLLFGFINTHQRHIKKFQGANLSHFFALQVSFIAGLVAGIGLLIFYGFSTAWYWPFALLAIAIIASGLLFGFLDGQIGQRGLSWASFVWPLFALLCYWSITELARTQP